MVETAVAGTGSQSARLSPVPVAQSVLVAVAGDDARHPGRSLAGYGRRRGRQERCGLLVVNYDGAVATAADE